ncbi:MAG: response regulator transcription factor [Myxococcota bacterium]|nr:response regulator transcription factor [Myxococcota bacterium]
MAPVPSILIIDDDRELCALLVQYLGEEGFRVEARHDGEEGLQRATSTQYDLVVLDVMLPTQSGFEVLRRLRTSSDVPVLMLTARMGDVDRIVGLELGADDYLSKPFNPRELVARIRAIRRRIDGGAGRADDRVLTDGELEIAPASRTVRRAGETLELTAAEYDLLDALVRSAGRIATREELSSKVLGRRFSPLDRSLDVHVSNLRRKLGASGARIKTVRGQGYLYARASSP